MAKKIIKIIIYAAVSIVLFILLNLFMSPKYIEKNLDGRTTAEFYREKLSNDILFVGSSTVYTGISPVVLWEKYGITSYDRSTASQTMQLSYYMVKDAIRVNKPKLVALDVGFIINGDDYYEEASLRKALDGMRMSSVKLEAIKECGPVYDYRKLIEYIFPLFRFHARWNDISSEDVKYMLYKPDVTYNGQIMEKGSMMFEEEQICDGSDESRAIGEGNMKYLQMLSDLCYENGIELLIIKMPRIDQTFTAYADTQLMDFAEKNNIIYKDFQAEARKLNAAGMSYSDSQHLNAYGAERFTIKLGEFITSAYNIRSRSGEPEYIKTWGLKSQRYRQDLQK